LAALLKRAGYHNHFAVALATRWRGEAPLDVNIQLAGKSIISCSSRYFAPAAGVFCFWAGAVPGGCRQDTWFFAWLIRRRDLARASDIDSLCAFWRLRRAGVAIYDSDSVTAFRRACHRGYRVKRCGDKRILTDMRGAAAAPAFVL
jgi:hypothetical protein